MYTPRSSLPQGSYVNYQNRSIPMSLARMSKAMLRGKKAAPPLDEIVPQEQPAPKQETDPRFARANIWKTPGWYSLPESLRRDILTQSSGGE